MLVGTPISRHRYGRLALLVLCLATSAIGCGGVKQTPAADAGVAVPDAASAMADAGPTADASLTPDAMTPPPDAMVPPPPPSDVAEMISAGGRVSGGGFQAEVQLGHWYGQGAFSGGAYTGQGAAAIKP